MFEEVKNQIRAYLPSRLSPFATASLIGLITLFITAVFISLEFVAPGILERLPPVVLNMLVLSLASILGGIAALLVGSKSRLVGQGEGEEKTERYFNYLLQRIDISYTMLRKDHAIYEYERVFVTTGNIRYPAVIKFVPLVANVRLRLLSMQGYRPAGGIRLKELKRWRRDIVVETDFKGPVEKGSENICRIKIEVRGRKLPPHLYIVPRYPVRGDLSFRVDLSRLRRAAAKAKLFTFVSWLANRPIIPTTRAPVKNFDGQKRLFWVIKRPKIDHMYLLSWREPCRCEWCKRINFG